MTESAAETKPIVDRSTGLKTMGCLQVGLGLLAALLIPVLLLPLLPSIRRSVESGGRQLDTWSMLFNVIFYAAVAAFFVGTGVGAMRKRRWVRPILLSIGWGWLLTGIATFVVMAMVLPRIFRTTPGLSGTAGVVGLVIVLGLIAVFYVVVPAAVVLFYGRPDVRATLEASDPIRRWTDACPVPVFGLSLWLAFFSLAMLFVASRGVYPVFTTLVTGPSAIILALVTGITYAYFARAAYRIRPVGWWGPLLLLGFQTISGAAYCLTGSAGEYAAASGMTAEQARMLSDSGMFGLPLALGSIAGFVVSAGYLLWVRRYFDAATA